MTNYVTISGDGQKLGDSQYLQAAQRIEGGTFIFETDDQFTPRPLYKAFAIFANHAHGIPAFWQQISVADAALLVTRRLLAGRPRWAEPGPTRKLVASLVVAICFVLGATAAPPAPPLPLPIHLAPHVRHFQVIKFTNNLTGRAETGVMRLDTITGATWILEDADINGTYVAVWVPINESLSSTADIANTNAVLVIPASKPASPLASP